MSPARQKDVVRGARPQRRRWDFWRGRIAHPALILATGLVTTAWFLYTEYGIAGQWGYSLDDSWIYATFARNVATGHGYSFNPGEHIAGATGPLYVFILALLYSIFGDVVLPAKALGILCLMASSLVLYSSAGRIVPNSRLGPLLAGLLLALSPVLAWGALSGMEIPVYLLLVCLGISAYARERWTLAAVWWSVGVWVRPDGLFLALIGLVARPGLSAKSLVRSFAAAGLLIVPYFAFNYAVGHSLLPTSVGIKAHWAGSLPAKEWGVFRQWLENWGLPLAATAGPADAERATLPMHGILLLPAMAAGAILHLRRRPAFVIYLVGFPLAFGVIGGGGGQYGRYIAHVIPFGILLAVAGLDHVSRRAWGRDRELGFVVLGALCLVLQVRPAAIVGVAHGWNVQNINGMQRYIAEATREISAPGDTIAVNDVGAMGYFSGCYVMDLVGLVSPRRPFPQNLSVYKPKALVIFPQWFDEYVTIDPRTNQGVFWSADSAWKYSPVTAVRLRNNTICARNTMYIYERLAPDGAGAPKVWILLH